MDDIEIGLELINKKKNRRTTSSLENEPEPIVEENIKIDKPKSIVIEETSEPDYDTYKNLYEKRLIKITEQIQLNNSSELNNVEVKEPNIIVENTINNIKQRINDIKEDEKLL